MELWLTLLISLGIAFGINMVMFLPAYFLHTDKLTDISYSITFITVATYGLLSFIIANGFSLSALVLWLMVVLWGVRLGGYLLIRIKKIQRDKRFDRMRSKFHRFLGFWVLQATTVWVVMLPSTMFFSGDGELPWYAYVGVVVWLVGMVIEAVADWQKYVFINNPANAGRWIDSGLWRYSRHPNYFGELLLWFGVYIFAVFGLSLVTGPIALIGPVFLTLLIVYVSGVRILERNANRKWGDNAEYQSYRRRTNVLLLLPPRG